MLTASGGKAGGKFDSSLAVLLYHSSEAPAPCLRLRVAAVLCLPECDIMAAMQPFSMALLAPCHCSTLAAMMTLEVLHKGCVLSDSDFKSEPVQQLPMCKEGPLLGVLPVAPWLWVEWLTPSKPLNCDSHTPCLCCQGKDPAKAVPGNGFPQG